MELNYVSLNVNHIHADWCGGTLYLSLSGDADSVRIFLKPDTDAARAILTAIHSAVELPSIVRPLDEIDAEAAEYMDAAEKRPKRIQFAVPFRRNDGKMVVWAGNKAKSGGLRCIDLYGNEAGLYNFDGSYCGSERYPQAEQHAEWYTGPEPKFCEECGAHHG